MSWHFGDTVEVVIKVTFVSDLETLPTLRTSFFDNLHGKIVFLLLSFGNTSNGDVLIRTVITDHSSSSSSAICSSRDEPSSRVQYLSVLEVSRSFTLQFDENKRGLLNCGPFRVRVLYSDSIYSRPPCLLQSIVLMPPSDLVADGIQYKNRTITVPMLLSSALTPLLFPPSGYFQLKEELRCFPHVVSKGHELIVGGHVFIVVDTAPFLQGWIEQNQHNGNS